MADRIRELLAPGAGAVLGAVGATAADVAIQAVSALSSLFCLALAIVRAGLLVVDVIKAHKKGKKTAKEAADDIKNIADDFRVGGGKDGK